MCCVTADIPARRTMSGKAARALSPTGHVWTADNIGNALAGREVARHLRELGLAAGGPKPLAKANRHAS